jgi:hypothetical protein
VTGRRWLRNVKGYGETGGSLRQRIEAGPRAGRERWRTCRYSHEPPLTHGADLFVRNLDTGNINVIQLHRLVLVDHVDSFGDLFTGRVALLLGIESRYGFDVIAGTGEAECHYQDKSLHRSAHAGFSPMASAVSQKP